MTTPDPVKIAAENETALISHLEQARIVYDQDPQMGCAAALETVLLYFWAKDIEPALHQPLRHLLVALANAKEGNADPVFAVATRDNKSPRTLWQNDFLEARLAAAVTLLLDAGDGLNEACSAVALACGEIRSADQIKDARKRITRKGGKSRPEIIESYYQTLREGRSRGLPAREIAHQMLDLLRETKVR
jgi:hypothetical protein